MNLGDIETDITKMIEQSGVERWLDPYPFRNRAQHLHRSLRWAQRIVQPLGDRLDKEAALLAALFHDVGVICSTPEHPKAGHELHGARIAGEYLTAHGMEPERVRKVQELIVGHTNREQLQAPDTKLEQIVVIEADMLDERGALGILWDAMAEGSQPEQSYFKTLERLKRRSFYRKPDRNPMRTPEARRIWAEKQQLHVAFIKALEQDLGMDP